MAELFVIMPFKTRPAAAEHNIEEIDFEATYQRLIRPAAQSADWSAIRVDEVASTGNISDHYLGKILSAELVLADVSLPNGNVYYELGIRQAISPGGTILIAHEGTALPFDISGQNVVFYGLDDLRLAVALKKLETALRAYELTSAANPVRAFLERVGATSHPRVDEAAFERDLVGRIDRAATVDQLVSVWQWARLLSPLPARPLVVLARRLSEVGDWHTSVAVLQKAAEIAPDDFEIHRYLGWHLRNLDPPRETEAVAEFELALKLNPNDPETLGMLGGLLKRQHKYSDAAKMYARGAEISPKSQYMLVNEAALSILSQPENPSHGIALYKKLREWIRQDPRHAGDPWAQLVCGEAAFATGDPEAARQHFTSALRLSASPNAYRSAAEQLDLLGGAGFRPGDAAALAKLLKAEVTALDTAGSESAGTPEPASLPVIVHLSDVHFGYAQKNGARVDMHRFSGDGEYSKSLSKHLATEFGTTRRAHFKYDHDRLFVIISGDLTYTASRQEFERVTAFLNELCASLSIGKERIFVVPGNHDVNWAASQDDPARRFDRYLSFVRKFLGKELFTKRYPRVPWEQLEDDPRPKASDIVAIQVVPGLLLVGLNSCVYETQQDHYGFVGGAQLDLVEELLDQYEPAKDGLRIAVMHHHLHPFPEPLASSKADEQKWQDLSTIRDAGLSEERLERLGFDLVLHGHKHQAQLRETLVRGRNEAAAPSRLIVCGAGSSGVNALELGHNDSNHYAVIEVLRTPRRVGADFLAIEWRELALRNNAEWATAERWTLSG